MSVSALQAQVFKQSMKPMVWALQNRAKDNFCSEMLGRLLNLVAVVAHIVAVPFILLAGLWDFIANVISGPEGSACQSLKNMLSLSYLSLFGFTVPNLIAAFGPDKCAVEFSASWINTVKDIYPECLA